MMNQKILIISDDTMIPRLKKILDGDFHVMVAEGIFAAPGAWDADDFNVVVSTVSPLPAGWVAWSRKAAHEGGGPGWILIGGAAEPPEVHDALSPFILETLPDDHAFLSIVLRAAETAEIGRENRLLEAELGKTMRELEEVSGTLVGVGGGDPLTGLINRGQLVEYLEAATSSSPFSILFIDVDHFFNFNDIHGMEEGDDLLQQLADVLSSRFSQYECVARYGGDEFVVVLTDTGCQDALVEAEELRRHLMNYPFFGCETQPLGAITVSIGVATFPDDSTDPAILLSKAECGAYAAKRISRNSVLRCC